MGWQKCPPILYRILKKGILMNDGSRIQDSRDSFIVVFLQDR